MTTWFSIMIRHSIWLQDKQRNTATAGQERQKLRVYTTLTLPEGLQVS
jgi:hypothetical protein